MIVLKSYKNSVVQEIEVLKSLLEQNCKSIDDLMKSGASRLEYGGEWSSKLENFLGGLIEAKEEAIREKEDDLVCPVCLETAEGEVEPVERRLESYGPVMGLCVGAFGEGSKECMD